MPRTHIQEHIDLIPCHEQEFLEKRTRVENVLKMDRKIARQVGLSDAAQGADVRELSKHTSTKT